MPAQVDIRISDNADWSKVFTFTDEDGNALDFTGSTFALDVRANPGDTVPVLALTSSSGLALSGTPTDGILTVTFASGSVPAGLNGLSASYLHDLVRTVGGDTEVLWRGSLTVDRGITR